MNYEQKYLKYKKKYMAIAGKLSEKNYYNVVLKSYPVNGRSAGLKENSELFKILKKIRNEINKRFPNDISDDRIVQGSEFHVELVDSINDKSKKENYNNVQKERIDLLNKSNWYCDNKAFALKIGKNFPDHKNDIHVTISYFPNGCNDLLYELRSIVENILKSVKGFQE